MKRLREMLASIITMLMVLTSISTAYAAEANSTKTITVNGLAPGDTVKYVQVIAWDNTNGWQRAAGYTTDNLPEETFKEILGSTTVAGKITDASATKIASAGVTMTDGGTVASDSTSWQKSYLEPGLYMVQAVPTSADVIYNPVFVAIQADGTNGEVNVINLNYDDSGTAKKSDVTVDKKAKSSEGEWEEATTEDVGDIINYKVETTIPAYLESYTNPVFTVTDELTDGLTFAVNKDKQDDSALTDISVKVGDVALVLDTDYKVTTKTASKWVIEFQKSYLQNRTAATLAVIEYSAMITDDAKNVNPETNTVSINYSRNPSDQSDHGTKEDKTTHYTFDIDAKLQGDEQYTTSEIIKVGQNADGTPITETKEYSNKTTHHPVNGAEFTLYKADGATKYTNTAYPDGVVITSANGGLLEIKGLDEGTYVLKETNPAAGYMLMTDYLKFEIKAEYKTISATDTCNAYKELDTYQVLVYHVTANGNETLTNTSSYTLDNGTIKKTDDVAGDVSTELINTKGQSLPSTGGIGTTIFYIVGGVMVAGAVVFLLTKRRMAGNE